MRVIKDRSESPVKWVILFLTCLMMFGEKAALSIDAYLNCYHDNIYCTVSDILKLLVLTSYSQLTNFTLFYLCFVIYMHVLLKGTTIAMTSQQPCTPRWMNTSASQTTSRHCSLSYIHCMLCLTLCCLSSEDTSQISGGLDSVYSCSLPFLPSDKLCLH